MSHRFKPGVSTALTAFASVAGIVGILHYLDIPALLEQRKRSRKVEARCYNTNDKPSLAEFRILVDQITLSSTYALASDIQKNIPIYDGAKIDLTSQSSISALQDEWAHILLHGPGVLVIKHFFTDLWSINTASEAYDTIIAKEATENAGKAKGDHFAPANANARIWNSLLKHGMEDPASFLSYYSNPLFSYMSEAYLGPAYRLTSQVNIVRPGGAAQTCHRDFHLGFQSAETAAQWSKAQHEASKLLTLQGAVAHSDMPLESGPTKFLPFSQGFAEGYLAYRLPEFQSYFEENYVALPLKVGDAVFFSPALFHAAGTNRTESTDRSANLIQVSAAWGKTMESMDFLPLIDGVWDLLVAEHKRDGLSLAVRSFVKAVAEGYSFPTNLDRRPPASGGMAPDSEQDFLLRGLSEGWSKEKLVDELTAMRRASAAL